MTQHQIHSLDLILPFWRYGALFERDQCSFLLDSAMNPERLGRYSSLGGDPSALLTGRRAGRADLAFDLTLTTWRTPSGESLAEPVVRKWTGDPFAALRDLQNAYRPGKLAEMPPGGQFQSGLAGYFGYEAGYACEVLPDTGEDDLQLPDLAFMVVDEVLRHDHVSKETTLSIVDRGDAIERGSAWRARLSDFEAQIARQDSPGSRTAPHQDGEVRAHFTRDRYCAAVQKCRDHIFAGDVFEVCLTHRLEMDLPGDPWELYSILKKINPPHFLVDAVSRFPGGPRLPGGVFCASSRPGGRKPPDQGNRPRGRNDEEHDGSAELAAYRRTEPKTR